GLDRRVRRPARRWLRLVSAPQRGDGAREPVLEGLVGFDLLQGWATARVPPGHVRTAGLRLRREGTRCPSRAAGLERPVVRRSTRERGGGPQAAVQPRL